jgi:hypothetical protein
LRQGAVSNQATAPGRVPLDVDCGGVRRATLTAVAGCLALAAAGCGSSRGSEPVPPPAPPQTASSADFPSARGKTLDDLRSGLPEGPILAPSVSLLDPGKNRLGFALFDRARKQITGAQVAIYTSTPDGTGIRGPFIARSESLAVEPLYVSRTVAQDPDAAHSVYVADVPFARAGNYVVTALAQLGGELVATNGFSVQVGHHGAEPPQVGQRAIRVHTPTLSDVGGDASTIDTREPPARDLLEDDLYDVLGRKPVVLTFATPLFCQSRVCAPVVDIVEQVKNTLDRDGRVAFIHVEIYRDNEVSEGFRPQVAAYRLPTEPWTFVIDRRGIVRARFEGAFSAAELTRAVARAMR